MLTNRLARLTELSILLVILGLAGYLRLAHNADNPGWYTDETTHIDIAQHLPQVQYMAVQGSTLLFARPPLFQLLLATLMRLLPKVEAIVVLRTLTGLLGVGSVALIYVLARQTGSVWFALWAALLLAIYPQAVVYSRFGFSYNLVAPLILLALLFSARWPVFAALVLGLALVTDVITLSFVLPFALLLVVTGRRSASPLRIGLSLLLVFVPFGVYAVVMLIRAPAAFVFDFQYTLSRLAPSVTLAQQAETLTTNFNVLFGQMGWVLVGGIGLCALPGRLRWMALLMFGLPLVSIGRTVPLYSLSAYYLIPLLLLIPLGIAALIWRVGQAVEKISEKLLSKLQEGDAALRLCNSFKPIIGIGLSLVVVGLAVPTVKSDFSAVEQGFVTPIDAFLMNPSDARAVAEYVNAQVQTDDVVIVSPPVGWLLKANAADFQMAVAASGVTTPHMPGDLPTDRWVFDPRFEAARLVVVDPLWTQWGVIHVPTLDGKLREVESWPLAFEAGEIRVYSNPHIASKSFPH